MLRMVQAMSLFSSSRFAFGSLEIRFGGEACTAVIKREAPEQKIGAPLAPLASLVVRWLFVGHGIAVNRLLLFPFFPPVIFDFLEGRGAGGG